MLFSMVLAHRKSPSQAQFAEDLALTQRATPPRRHKTWTLWGALKALGALALVATAAYAAGSRDAEPLTLARAERSALETARMSLTAAKRTRRAAARAMGVLESQADALVNGIELPRNGDMLGARTIEAHVCNGMANQRLAFVAAALLARKHRRDMIMPQFILDGTQATDAQLDAESLDVDARPVAHFYDASTITEALRALDIEVWPLPAPNPHRVKTEDLWKLDHVPHVAVGCVGFPDPRDWDEGLAATLLAAMRPARRLEEIADEVERRLAALTDTGAFTVLHLRAEKDWVDHCARWQAIPDGVTRDNCFNRTSDVGDALREMRVTTECPVLVATQRDLVDPDILARATDSLGKNGYAVVFRDEIAGDMPKLQREEAAIVDYELARRAHQFVGNSVSTFSALAILERRWAGTLAGWYNGGNMPLEAFGPATRLPVVFCWLALDNANEDGTRDPHAGMLVEALESAIRVGRAEAYVLWAGGDPDDSPLAARLRALGARVVKHDPAWTEAVYTESQRRRAEGDKWSPLFASRGSVLATWLRVDIPLLRELEQFSYALYLDCDTLVLRQLRLADFAPPLPRSFMMGYEMQDEWPYNAGVALINLPRARETHDAFVAWILAQKNGLLFDEPWYGVMDQGAICSYYEQDLRAVLLPRAYNAKPYQALVPGAAILHWHGPKPHQLARWAQTGLCEGFGDMCLRDMAGAACTYLEMALADAAAAATDGQAPARFKGPSSRLRDVCAGPTLAERLAAAR